MTNSAATPLPSKVNKSQSRSERSEQKIRARNAAQRAEQAENAEQSQNADAPNIKPNNAFADKKNIMWVLLSGAMALTFVVMLFLPDTGMGSGLILCHALVWILWCCALALQSGKWLGRVCLWKRSWASDSIYFTTNID